LHRRSAPTRPQAPAKRSAKRWAAAHSGYEGTVMEIGVIGTGHVGLVTCATLACIGHVVTGIDADGSKIDALVDGRAPFFEPDLDSLLASERASGRLSFSHLPADAVKGKDAVFVCVGTPPGADGDANLLAVERAADLIAASAES